MTKQELIARELCGRYYFGVHQGYEICVKSLHLPSADEVVAKLIAKSSKICKENSEKNWPQFMDDAKEILDRLEKYCNYSLEE